MTAETLSERVYGPNRERALLSLRFSLERAFEGLKVSLTDVGADREGWVTVSIKGEDSEVALEYVRKMYGTALRRGEASRLSEVRGKVSEITSETVIVNVGPGGLRASIPWSWLRIQLAPAAENLEETAKTLCIIKNIPMYVKIICPDIEPMQAKLSERQVKLYASWVRSGLDRVIVSSVTKSMLKKALKSSGLTKSSIIIEQLGVLEHSILCSLASTPKSLASAIQRVLPEANVAIFDPMKAKRIMGSRLLYP